MASSVAALTPSFYRFPHLPYELRLAIIEEFLYDIGHMKTSERKSGPPFSDNGIITTFRRRGPPPGISLAAYATIDKQWKLVIEKRTFYSLSLDVAGIDNPNVLDDFERICVGDRIDKISDIQLSIFVDNVGCRYPGSSTNIPNAATDKASRADTDDDTEPPIAHAERVATPALGHFFRVVAGWTRDREPINFECNFLRQGKFTRRPVRGTRLAIDSSSFPEVPCIGSLDIPDGFYWGIQPGSIFQLLTRLPNVERSGMTFDDDLASSDIVKIVQEGCSTPSFSGSKIRTLHLESPARWHREHDLSLYTHPSLQLSQSIFAMTSRLESLSMHYVADVSAFLRQASIVSRNTPQSKPVWPNLRILIAYGSSGSSASGGPAIVAEFYDSITEALPHMPSITLFEVGLSSAFYVNMDLYWDDVIVHIGVPPREDRSAMPDGILMLAGAKPDEDTVDTWQQIARRQWHCKLAGFPRGSFTPR